MARSLLVTIGHGGSTVHLDDGSRLSGYESADTVVERCAAIGYPIEPGTPIIDQTTIPWETLVDFACAGPMCDPRLPDQTRSRLLGDIEPYTGKATSLDYVSRDVWVSMALQRGATMTVA